jgi:hypothetical protein
MFKNNQNKMDTQRHSMRYELDLDDLRELTSLLNIQVRGDRRKRISYLIALNEFLSVRMKSKRLEGLFELDLASATLPAVYRALEF